MNYKGFLLNVAIRRNTVGQRRLTAKKGIFDPVTRKNDALTNIFAALTKSGKTRLRNPTIFGSGFS
jgi:hypothetical protein